MGSAVAPNHQTHALATLSMAARMKTACQPKPLEVDPEVRNAVTRGVIIPGTFAIWMDSLIGKIWFTRKDARVGVVESAGSKLQ